MLYAINIKNNINFNYENVQKSYKLAKLLYGWGKRKYEKEREKRWHENWSQWKNSSEQENLKGGPCYESPKKKLTSRMFEHLIYNLKSYNGIEI